MRRSLVRLAAPVAFLAAVTAAALLARPALERGSAQQHPTTPRAGTTATTTRTTAPKQRPRISTYRVQSGDTLSAIARKTGTTVARLEQLNPGVDPTALQVGQRIRVQ